MTEEHRGVLRLLAEDCRTITLEAATAAVGAVQRHNFDGLPDGEGREVDLAMLLYADGHTGAAPTAPDVVARDAAFAVVSSGVRRLREGPRALIEAGEEASTPTRRVLRDDWIARLDALDGTSAAELRWDGYCGVVLLDRVRSIETGRASARHLAGSIVCATGCTVSWAQWSSFDSNTDGYRRLNGAVYIGNPLWGIPMVEVMDRRWERARGTVASVASSHERFERFVDTLHALPSAPTTVFNMAGNPLAPALIAGTIEYVMEPNPVTLHDSALLIPHQLLGGVITTAAGEPLDYLRLYERSALRLASHERPVSDGYIAWGGPVATSNSDVA